VVSRGVSWCLVAGAGADTDADADGGFVSLSYQKAYGSHMACHAHGTYTRDNEVRSESEISISGVGLDPCLATKYSVVTTPHHTPHSQTYEP
jgi:hypothetical protein